MMTLNFRLLPKVDTEIKPIYMVVVEIFTIRCIFSKDLKNEKIGADFIRAMLGGGDIEQAPKTLKVSAKFRYIGGFDKRIDMLSVYHFQEFP
jgi:hypothetical protein